MAYVAIRRKSELNAEESKIWMTDSGEILGRKVEELNGDFVIEGEDGTRYTARLGTMEDGKFLRVGTNEVYNEYRYYVELPE